MSRHVRTLAACLAATAIACGSSGDDDGSGATDGGVNDQPDATPCVNARAGTTAGGVIENPRALWNGREIGVVWVDSRDGNREIYFARFDALGNQLGADLRVTDDPAESTEPALGSDGDEWGVAWTDLRDEATGGSEVFAARIDRDGAVVVPATNVSQAPGASSAPAILANSGGWLVTWEDDRNGDYDLYLATLDSQMVGGRSPLVDGAGNARRPSTTLRDGTLALAWDDDRDGADKIYMKIVGEVEQLVTPTDSEAAQALLVPTATGYLLGFNAQRPSPFAYMGQMHLDGTHGAEPWAYGALDAMVAGTSIDNERNGYAGAFASGGEVWLTEYDRWARRLVGPLTVRDAVAGTGDSPTVMVIGRGLAVVWRETDDQGATTVELALRCD